MRLDEIGKKFGTDKSSLGHNYLGLYELLFWKSARKPDQRILEIGIQFGYSLKTWQEYFRCPVITGIDSVDNGVLIDRVEVIIGNAYSPDVWSQVADREFDIIIDDASHAPEHQAYSVQHYSQLLSYDGLLIIEDVTHRGTIDYLKTALPEGFTHVSAELPEGSTVDSRLFLVWRK